MKIKCIKYCSVKGVNNLHFNFEPNKEYDCSKIKNIYFVVFDVLGNTDYIADNGVLLSEYFDVELFNRKEKLQNINEKM